MDRQSKARVVLGNSKKLIVLQLSLFLFQISCSCLERKVSITEPVPAVENKTKDEGHNQPLVVKGFTLTLRDENRKCVLDYSANSTRNVSQSGQIGLDMDSPCEYIRMHDTLEPLLYSFGKGFDEHTVLIIVGGPPDPDYSDVLQPNGCGTELQRISVFENKIDVDTKIDGNGAMCPSQGLDRVWFLG